MSAAVIVFPGSNCDRDCKVAVERSTGEHVEMVWHAETELPRGLDLIVIPGGFSYGDYLRCGAMAAQSPVMQAVKKAADDGVAVVGVCNGFQILCEAGLLPGALVRNEGLHFICRDEWLRVEATNTAWTSRYEPGAEILVVTTPQQAAQALHLPCRPRDEWAEDGSAAASAAGAAAEAIAASAAGVPGTWALAEAVPRSRAACAASPAAGRWCACAGWPAARSAAAA